MGKGEKETFCSALYSVKLSLGREEDKIEKNKYIEML